MYTGDLETSRSNEVHVKVTSLIWDEKCNQQIKYEELSSKSSVYTIHKIT